MVAIRQNIASFRIGRYPDDAMNLRAQDALANCSSVLQAIRNWCEMHDWLEELSGTTYPKHPNKTLIIAEAKNATSTIETLLSSHYLHRTLISTIPTTYAASQILKKLRHHRFLLSIIIIVTKNLICLLLEQYPQIRHKKDLSRWFTPNGIDWLWQIQLSKYDRYLLDSELTLLDYIKEQIKQIDILLVPKNTTYSFLL
jgi:hypothetical protein